MGCRGARGGGLPSRLDRDDRLHPRGGARRGHEFARGGDRLDIEKDCGGILIVREKIEHVAEIDIAHVSE